MWWETIFNTKKLFPNLDPIGATFVYLAFVVLFVLLLMLLIWFVIVRCQDRKAQSAKKNCVTCESDHYGSFITPFPYSRISSFSSISHPSARSPSDCYLVRPKSNTRINPGQGMHTSTPRRVLSVPLPKVYLSKRKQPKYRKQQKKLTPNEKSILLRNDRIYYTNPDGVSDVWQSTFNNHNNHQHPEIIHERIKKHKGIRPKLIPRAKWNSDDILEFLRKQREISQANSSATTNRQNRFSISPFPISPLPRFSAYCVDPRYSTNGKLRTFNKM